MNENIITAFEALAIQTKQCPGPGSSYRFRSHETVTKILKSLDFEINNSEQIKDIKGIGKSTVKRVDEILESGTLSEIKLKNTKFFTPIAFLFQKIMTKSNNNKDKENIN